MVRIPARIPPKISEVRLSPTMTASSFLKSGIVAKQRSKNEVSGLLQPSSSEMKICSKNGSISALLSLLFCTDAVPFVAR